MAMSSRSALSGHYAVTCRWPAYRWFCGLSIEDKILDHSTFSRHATSGSAMATYSCMCSSGSLRPASAGLVGGEGFAVDASLIVADANKQRSIPGKMDKNRAPEKASRAVKGVSATLDDVASAEPAIRSRVYLTFRSGSAVDGAMRGPAFFAYSDNYLIDVKCGVILVPRLRGTSDRRSRHLPDDGRANRATLWPKAQVARW